MENGGMYAGGPGDEFVGGHHEMPPGVNVAPGGGARYASPKAGGGLYQADPYFDQTGGAGSWYVPPNGPGPGGYVGPGGGGGPGPNSPYSTGHPQQQQQQHPGAHHPGGQMHHMSHSPHISSPPNNNSHHHQDPYGPGGSGPNGVGGPVLVGGVPHMDSDLVQVVSGDLIVNMIDVSFC